MKGYLILAHGSQRSESEKVLDSLMAKVRREMGPVLVESAYLQFSDRDLRGGIQSLVAAGVTQIGLVPLFLFDGVHVTQDIPREAAEILADFPGVSLTMSQHLGDDDRIAQIIIDRIGAIA